MLAGKHTVAKTPPNIGQCAGEGNALGMLRDRDAANSTRTVVLVKS